MAGSEHRTVLVVSDGAIASGTRVVKERAVTLRLMVPLRIVEETIDPGLTVRTEYELIRFRPLAAA